MAKRLKTILARDFSERLKVFVSSDNESIAAGEDWLRSVERALKESALLMILCSPASIKRPWINFEAGAAWMLSIPLVPICHAGLMPRDLPVPLSLRQGVALEDPEGLRGLYKRVADVLKCDMPTRSFEELANELRCAPSPDDKSATVALARERAVRKRLKEALEHHRFRWRTLERLATEAAISQETAANFLRSEPEVRFSKGKSGEVIVGLRSRVD